MCRTQTVILGVVLLFVFMAQAMAASTGPLRSTFPIRGIFGASGMRATHVRISPSQLAQLGTPVTREMQIKALSQDPTAAERLKSALSQPGASPMGNDPWKQGIVLTPLSPQWPAGTGWDNTGAYLSSTSVFFDPWHPLPLPGQSPPYVSVIYQGSNGVLCTLDIRWPQTGSYLVTVSARSEYPTDARPRFGLHYIPNAQLDPMSPDVPGNAMQWTALVTVNAITNPGPTTYGFYASQPAKIGTFIEAYLGQVTIRKL